MGGKNHYILNKPLDYQRGFCRNILIQGDSIGIRRALEGSTYFMSRIYDGKEKDMEWHRMTLRNSSSIVHAMLITVFAANEREIERDGERIDIEQYICNQHMTLDNKKKHMQSFLKLSVWDGRDLLLHQVRGRYVWFCIELFPAMDPDIVVGDICLFFPKETWIRYLPEIFHAEQQDAFLERFLCIFQTLYEELNETIKNFTDVLQPEACPSHLLSVISSWLSVENSHIWSEETFRYKIGHGVHFYRYRGTVRSIKELVYLYTGEEPFVIEFHQMEEERVKTGRQKLLTKLYGENPFAFTVLVREKSIHSPNQVQVLSRILEETIPAHMNCHIVVLRPYLFLDRYSYLGVNSMMSAYQSFELNQAVMLPLAKI